MRKFFLVFLCSLFCASAAFAAKATTEPLETELILHRNRFASPSEVEARLILTAHVAMVDDILLFDAANQPLPQSPVQLEKGEELELDLLLPVDEKALKNASVSVKIKYPIKNKKEIQYKNLQAKAAIKVVDEAELDALDIDLSQIPEIVVEGQALSFPLHVQNFGSKAAQDIRLEVAEQSLSIGDLGAGKSKEVTLDLGEAKEALNLAFTLHYVQDGEEKITEIEGMQIHLGFPFIHFQERK